MKITTTQEMQMPTYTVLYNDDESELFAFVAESNEEAIKRLRIFSEDTGYSLEDVTLLDHNFLYVN